MEIGKKPVLRMVIRKIATIVREIELSIERRKRETVREEIYGMPFGVIDYEEYHNMFYKNIYETYTKIIHSCNKVKKDIRHARDLIYLMEKLKMKDTNYYRLDKLLCRIRKM